MGDRIVETAFWIVLAILGYLSPVIWVNALFPVICITRAFVVDSIRSVALSKGFTAFGSSSMQSTEIGKFICASRFMRILYAVAKIAAFATVEVLFEFPDGSRDKQNIILQMEFEYDADASIWKISDIQSSAIKLQSIGR